MFFLTRFLCFFSLLAILAGCDNGSEQKQQYTPKFSEKPLEQKKEEYIFGIHPLHNPQQLQSIYDPLMDYLSAHIPEITFRLEASRNYAAFEEKLYAGKFQFALPNPYHTVVAADGKGYKIIAKMGNDDNFRGIIVVRKDSGITDILQLKGKKISYPAPTALAATLLPQYYLATHGIDVNKDVENLYVGTHESSLMNVYLKQVSAGATWPSAWKFFEKEHPEFANELEVKWQTDKLPNNGIIANNDVPAAIVNKVADLLINLHTVPEGQEILARMPLERFEKADSQTFQPVREFVDNFTRTVRPLTR